MSKMLTLVTMTTTKFSLLILLSSSVVSSLSTWRRSHSAGQAVYREYCIGDCGVEGVPLPTLPW